MPWRLLEEGEKVLGGDECFSLADEEWLQIEARFIEGGYLVHRGEVFRRRFTQEEPQQGSWSTKPPSVPGYYWRRLTFGGRPFIKDVFRDSTNGELLIGALEGVNDHPGTFEWWSLPILAPADQLGRAVPLADASPPSVAETEKHPPLQLPKEEEL